MGKRKRERAEQLKEARKARSYAVLRNCPLSAQKVRLVADTVRGVDVNRALGILRYTERNSAPYLRKLLLSALDNWKEKNEGADLDGASLVVKTIMVDEGRTLKRMRPRAQGRGARILKRSCHVYVEVGSKPTEAEAEGAPKKEQEPVTE